MTAEVIIFDPHRSIQSDPNDETDRLVSALGRYTKAELLELLYVGEEPGFFELMRGLFTLSDDSRLILQNFLADAAQVPMAATIDSEGRLVLHRRTTLDRKENFPRRTPL
jgi:hypothetical protein